MYLQLVGIENNLLGSFQKLQVNLYSALISETPSEFNVVDRDVVIDWLDAVYTLSTAICLDYRAGILLQWEHFPISGRHNMTISGVLSSYVQVLCQANVREAKRDWGRQAEVVGKSNVYQVGVFDI